MMPLLETLFNTDQPIRRYVWKAYLIAFIPSIIISMAVGFLFPEDGPSFEGSIASLVIGIIIVGPWIETLLMLPIIWLAKRFLSGILRVAVASALTWAVLHSLIAPVWGLGVFWPFVVFSISYLEWSKKSIWKGIAVTALIHTCQNFIPTIVLITIQ